MPEALKAQSSPHDTNFAMLKPFEGLPVASPWRVMSCSYGGCQERTGMGSDEIPDS